MAAASSAEGSGLSPAVYLFAKGVPSSTCWPVQQVTKPRTIQTCWCNPWHLGSKIPDIPDLRTAPGCEQRTTVQWNAPSDSHDLHAQDASWFALHLTQKD